MPPLHEYIAKQLAEKLKSRKVVVWYDERREFAPFVAKCVVARGRATRPCPISVGGVSARLAEYAGSMFELRAVVEPFVSGDSPTAVVVYLPGCERDRRGSVLMELEKAGRRGSLSSSGSRATCCVRGTPTASSTRCWRPSAVSYEDLARAVGTSSTEPPSILKSIFHDTRGNDGLLAAWLASDARDGR